MRRCISACPVTVVSLRWVILILLFVLTAFAKPTQLTGRISVNCGSTGTSVASDGRRWLGDVHKEFTVKGSSAESTVMRELILSSDPVPYRTARISCSRFSYIFQVSSGQKLIRFHFYPTLYSEFESTKDLFTVEAGSFTLLRNFSASITADALAVNTLTKEYCTIVEENSPLNITFYPVTTSSQSGDTHAFINGIEIISVPDGLSYCHTGDVGVQVAGEKSLVYIGKSTALEIVHRQNVKQVYVSSGDDLRGMFGMWAAVFDKKPYMADKFTWRVSVDLGFRYLVRFDFCELGLKMAETGNHSLSLFIDHMVANNTAEIFSKTADKHGLLYLNYIVVANGRKLEGKRDIIISLHLKENFKDGHGPLEGFEIFKLSNHDNSLASPNPLTPPRDSPPSIMQNWLWILGLRDTVAAIVIAILCLVNIIVHVICKIREETFPGEENKPSPRATRTCQVFSLAEIQSATKNFNDKFVVGKGGFGKVYRGSINGSQTVAIKRLKLNSRQGEREFWTEVETLSELRHVNLVSLIGYCNEQQEMILVYEFMPNGTLADHLYKLARENSRFTCLSWDERLKICIGAGRGLDYLHTGKSVLHRDVKASNILLNEIFVPKVSDFGLAKMPRTEFGSELQSQDSTNLKGTIGYIDPDYFRTHKLTKKSDTYAFGVVLLEVLCGRPAVDHCAEGDERSLTMWARDKVSRGEINRIICPSLRGEILPASLKTFPCIAERCLHEEPHKRPTIAHVVVNLEYALEQQNTRFSVPYGFASVRDLLPFTDAENVVPREITNAASILQNDDKVLLENAKLLLPNEIECVSNMLPYMDRTSMSTPQLTTASSNEQNSTSAIQKPAKVGMVNAPYGKREGRKSIKHRLSRFFPDLDRTSMSTSQHTTVSSHEQNSTFSMQNQTNSGMADAGPPYGKKDGRKSVKLKLSQLLPWKRAKISKDAELFVISKSEPITKKNMPSRVSITNQEKAKRDKDGRSDLISTPSVRKFSFKELKVATRNFQADAVIGVGGFGSVFKGFIKEKSTNKNGSGSIIAIKQLSTSSKQGLKELLAEIYFLGRLSHPNLLKLLGYCLEGEARLIVYEFMEKRSLDYHLFPNGSAVQVLPWNTRIKILTGAARGLAFLHSLDVPIIFRDLKTSNILLDESYNAKLSDFGLARYGPSSSETHVTTQVAGTVGYLDPEYVITGHLNTKSDIYGFGVVLLEMLTGLRAADINRPSEQQYLVSWIKPDLNAANFANFVDSRLKGTYPPQSAFQVYQLAINCLQIDSKARPPAEEVVETLEKLELAVEKPREHRVHFSPQITDPDDQ